MIACLNSYLINILALFCLQFLKPSVIAVCLKLLSSQNFNVVHFPKFHSTLLQNVSVTAFTVFELLSENQQGVEGD